LLLGQAEADTELETTQYAEIARDNCKKVGNLVFSHDIYQANAAPVMDV
jgi:hypothetical protein